jgi:hypothetical protein
MRLAIVTGTSRGLGEALGRFGTMPDTVLARALAANLTAPAYRELAA